MKKLLISLLTLLTLSTLADSSHADVSAFKALADQETISVLDGGFFDYDYYMQNGITIPQASLDSISEEEASNSKSMALNRVWTQNETIYTDEFTDLLPLLTFSENKNVVHKIDDSKFHYIDASTSEDDPKFMQLYLSDYNPQFYFDKSYSGNITFYSSISFTRTDLDALNNLIISEVELPIIVVNEAIYATLVLKGADNGYEFQTSKGCSLEYNQAGPTAVYPESGAGPFSTIKITIPYVEKITRLSFAQLATYSAISEITNSITWKESTPFYFDSSMHGKYYMYRFGLESISIKDKYFVIDYDNMFAVAGENYTAKAANVHYLKLEYTETTKRYITDSDGKQTVETTTKNPQIIEIEMDSSVGRVDGLIKYCYFDMWQMSSDPTVSGSIKILEIGFDMYAGSSFTNQTIYYQDYTNVNLHEYSFNSTKSIRIYTYKWSGYKRDYYTNNRGFWDYLFAGPAQYVLDSRYLYQCYGFNFFFDKYKMQPIPGVKKIALKWQCGYETPNPEADSDGWYPDDSNNVARNIKIATKTVDANKKLLNYALDDDGMFISSDTDEALMTDPNGIVYDYVVCKKFTKGNLDTYITQMAPLEIYYESEELDLIQMVGNSNGYHVCVDDDGVSRVYDKDGQLVDFLGVYVAPDGTQIPASDANGDGIYTADETVDVDTGEGRQYFDDPLAEKSEIDKFLDWWESLTNSIKNFKWDRLFTIIILFVIVIIFGPSLIDWVKKVFSKK